MELLKQAKDRVMGAEFMEMQAVMRRRVGLTMAQLMAIPSKAPPLLFPSVAEAIVGCVVYILFLRFIWMPRDWVNYKVHFGIALVVSVFYLVAVFFGIRYMDARPPKTFRVYETMLVYNVYHLVLNAYLAARILWELRSDHLALMGSDYEPEQHGYTLAFLLWVFYNSKYVELLETAFIIATKQFRAITTLHVAQKILFIWWWFLVCRLDFRGDSYFPALTSSVLLVFVHAGYVFAILNVPFLPWQKLIPRLFQLECVLCLLHALYGLYWSSLPFWVGIAQLTVMLFLLLLLVDYHFFGTATRPATPSSAPALFFSFDSSAWFYLYHFGVAHFLQTRVVGSLKEPFGCSGASGGSLVGACLVCGVDCQKMAEYVISCRKICKLNVFKLLPCVETAMDMFLPATSAQICNRRLLVLATKVIHRPPFFMGEVISKFEEPEDVKAALRASCHVPVIGGILPYKTKFGYYYDGFFWSSGFGFVDWRSISPKDTVLRVSGMGGIGADIRPPFIMPPWWAIFPPPESVLRGLFWRGYQDAEDYFLRKKAVVLPRPEGDQPPQSSLQTLKRAVLSSWSNFVLFSLGCAALVFVIDLLLTPIILSDDANNNNSSGALL